MNDDKFAKWKATRKQGTLFFLLKFPFLVMASTSLLLIVFHQVTSFFGDKSSVYETLITFVPNILIVSIFSGVFIWYSLEQNYQKSIGNKSFDFWIPKQSNK